MSTLLQFTAGFALLFAVTMAIAGDLDTFSTLDTNGDGVISLEESVQEGDLNSAFDKVDANADGKIDEDEFEVYQRAAVDANAE